MKKVLFSGLLAFSCLSSFAQNKEKDYFMCMHPPQFKGGLDSLYQFFANNLVFPEELTQQKSDYSAIIELKIGEDGKVDKFTYFGFDDDCKSCEIEISRICKLLAFIAGEDDNGNKIGCVFTINIRLSWQKKCVFAFKSYNVHGWNGDGRKVYYTKTNH